MAQNPDYPTDSASAVEAQLAFVLQHPGMSDWIKRALLDAVNRPPIEVLNDLEILNRILRSRAEVMLSGVCQTGEATLRDGSRTDPACRGKASAELGSG